MKSFAICAFFVVLAAVVSGDVLGNGRPGCMTEEEISVGLYRNLWDPTAYWKCTELNELAASERCPDQMAFQDHLKKCVDWDDWEWEELQAPPSSA